MDSKGSVSLQDIYTAYRKFKTQVYYNSSTLDLRHKLAQFECDNLLDFTDISQFKDNFTSVFEPLRNFINKDTNASNNDFFNDLLSRIDYKLIPKNFKDPDPYCDNDKKDHIITNEIYKGSYILDKYNALIDAPIEIHIISILWLITVGKKIYPYLSKNNYAYRLSITDHEPKIPIDKEDVNISVSSGLMLYEPYYIGYQEWRDQGIRQAELGLDSKENVTILSLDIKKYYYSIRMNIEKLEMYFDSKKFPNNFKLNETEKKLNCLLQKIHLVYSEKIKTLFKIPDNDISEGNVPLPIGLFSSGLLSNFFLSPFDRYIENYITPSYYGRYVDDILFVFAGKTISNIRTKQNVIHDFIKNHLCKHEANTNYSNHNNVYIFIYKKDDNQNENSSNSSKPIDNISDDTSDVNHNESEDICYHIKIFDADLGIQPSKIIMEYFNHRESRAALNKFKKRLERNRSEFRYLPFDYEVNTMFDDEAFKMEYSESINKLRSIQGISEDKYGASKYLAHKLFLSILPIQPDKKNRENLKASSRQILTYFRGQITLIMYSLWEKVATYFIINNDIDNLNKFYQQAIDAIDLIKLKEEENHPDVLSKITEDLKTELNLSVAMAMSLDPESLKSFKYADIITNVMIGFRRAYLFRHNYQYLRAYCYTLNLSKRSEDSSLNNTSLIIKDLYNIEMDFINHHINNSLISPVFLSLHDISLVYYLCQLQNIKNSDKKIKCYNYATTEIIDIFHKFNYDWRHIFESDNTQHKDKDEPKDDNRKNETEKILTLGRSTQFYESKHKIHRNARAFIIDIIERDSNTVDVDKTIGIVNWKIDSESSKNALKGNPDISIKRRNELFEILNYAIKKKVEILIFPEISLPYNWLPLIVSESAKNNLAIIAGIEYITVHDIPNKKFQRKRWAINCMVTILPIKTPYYNTALIFPHIKNYYAPSEISEIESLHYDIPVIHPEYTIFHWRHVYFTAYNCFELSNISDRAIFKSFVDFIVAIEYNKDITYYSNIIEAWSRDLHCFVLQSNSSQYGDSRIVQPTKNEIKDILKVKGGEFPLVLIGKLSINDLRDFQRHAYQYQLNNKAYKPTPAYYDWEITECRINDMPLKDLINKLK